MNNSLLIALVDDSVRMVEVAFIDKETGKPDASQRSYTYKCNIPDIKQNDTVVVETYAGFSVACVIDVDTEIDMDSNHSFRWVVQKLDMGDHHRRTLREAKLIVEVNKLRANNMRDQLIANLGVGDRQTLLAHIDGVVDEPEIAPDDVNDLYDNKR